MPYNYLIPTFASGEITPSLYARVDFQNYYSGLRTLRNFTVMPEGGATRRSGTKFIAKAKLNTADLRMKPFIFAQDDALVLVFGQNYVRFYKNDAPVTTTRSAWPTWASSTLYNPGQYVNYGGNFYQCTGFSTASTPGTDGTWTLITQADPVPYEVYTPYLSTDISTLKIQQSGVILFIACPTQPPMQLVRFSDTNWQIFWINSKTQVGNGTQITRANYTKGPFMPVNPSSGINLLAQLIYPYDITTLKLLSTQSLFQPAHVGGVFKINYTIPASSYTYTVTSGTVNSSITSSPFAVGGAWRFQTDAAFNGYVTIQTYDSQNNAWINLSATRCTGTAVVSVGGDQTNNYKVMRMVISSSVPASVIFFLDQYQKPTVFRVKSYVNPTTVNVDLLEDFPPSLSSTDSLTLAGLWININTWNWQEGSWSDYRGYPSCSCFYQDRLCFANTASEPQTFWASRTSNYYDFSQSPNLVATDSISLIIPSRKLGQIQDLIGINNLIIALTASAEWSISGGPSGVFTTTSIVTKASSYRGSSGVSANLIGDLIVFAQSMGSVLRTLGYDLTKDGYASEAISLLSSHLFKGYTIKEMVYQQEPNSILWVLRSDGMLLSLTMVPEQKVFAWAWHDTLGEVLSITSIPGKYYNDLWLLVNRGGTNCIERMRHKLTAQNRILEYSFQFNLGGSSFTQITGMTSWIGKSVDILLDVGLVSQRTLTNVSVTAATLPLVDPISGNSISAVSASISPINSMTQWFLDAAVGGTYQSGISTLTGLDHLNGQTVSILADGVIQPAQTVASGSITLPAGTNSVVAGLPYTSDLETLNIEIPNQLGTIQGKKVKVAQAVLRLQESRGGFIGPNSKFLDTIHYQFDVGPTDLVSKDVKQALNAQYEEGGRVFIRQSDPLPMTILAVIPSVSVGA